MSGDGGGVRPDTDARDLLAKIINRAELDAGFAGESWGEERCPRDWYRLDADAVLSALATPGPVRDAVLTHLGIDELHEVWRWKDEAARATGAEQPVEQWARNSAGSATIQRRLVTPWREVGDATRRPHCDGHGGPGRRYCCQHPDAGWPCTEEVDQ